MPKVLQQSDGRYVFQCPGCLCAHWFQTAPAVPAWMWNCDVERPTISPSINVRGEIHCHSFVKDGLIQFLDDCEHALKGQTVELPEI